MTELEERVERLERLCLTCWDAYIGAATGNRVLLELAGSLAMGRVTPGGMTANEVQAWLEERSAEIENDVLIEVGIADKALAALLSERAEVRRRRGRK